MAHDMSTAFYLLKPDALELGAPVERARTILSHLDVISSRDLVLTSHTVEALWAGHRSDLHPIATSFLNLYLVGRTSRLVVVAGADALLSVMRMKRQLRIEFGQGAFANVVHAPSSQAENQEHQAILDGRSVGAAGTSTANPPATEPLLGLAREAVSEAVGDIWCRAQRRGWAALAQPEGVGSAQIWLVADEVQSIDSAVSRLWAALPDLNLATAIAVVCEAERCGRSLALTESFATAYHAADRLRAYGLLAEVVAARPRPTT